MSGEKESIVKDPLRAKKLEARIVNELEQLAPGQSLFYKLPEVYWEHFAAFLIAEPNPEYPNKGKKYCMYTDKIADGKPAGVRVGMGQTNNPKQVANWIAQRQLFVEGSVERYQ